MSLDAAQRNKLLERQFADDIYPKFFCQRGDEGTYLWMDMSGVKASILIDDKFFENQHDDYRRAMIASLYDNWANARGEMLDGQTGVMVSRPVTSEDKAPKGMNLQEYSAKEAVMIIERLNDKDELLALLEQERTGKDRKSVVYALENRLDELME